MVFVVDKHKRPLMPCTPKRARLLLSQGRAVVHHLVPFVIRLKDRRVEECAVQPLVLKLDPGAKTSGLALARFDMQLMHNPEIAGLDYQQGTLAGWETRAYVLEKFQHRCAYCDKGEVPFELDHIRPKSRGGSERVSNLALSCHDCNQSKGNRTAEEFGHPEVEAQAKAPLKDAAAVNATRYKLVEALSVFGLPLGTWSGGRTRWNRARFNLAKTHALDALCVGDLAGVHVGTLRTLRISATGRGRYCRTLFNRFGFPREI
jgi:RRXRR protein/HNH endonuclease